MKKFTDLQVNVFKSSVDRKSTMDKDGPVTFLDRQNLDCGPVNVIHIDSILYDNCCYIKQNNIESYNTYVYLFDNII